MSKQEYRPSGGWLAKFSHAFRGIGDGVRGQSSFLVHFIMLFAVLAAAAIFRLEATQWCLVLLCCGLVLSAELFNSCLETMAKTIDRTENRDLGRALDMASGAVLVASIFAAIVGLIVFLPQVI
jgi:diacylglycerol kinase